MKILDSGNENNIKYISEVVETLKQVVSAKFRLVVVMEKKSVSSELLQMQNDILQIKTIRKFAPVKHTDIMGDIRGWYKILSEVSKIDSECYFRNLRKRQKEVYPQIIKNKIKKYMKFGFGL